MSENHLYSKDRHRAGMRKLSYSMTCTTRPAHLSPPGDCFEQLHSFRVGCDCSKKGLTDWLKTAAEHLNTLWIIILPCGSHRAEFLKIQSLHYAHRTLGFITASLKKTELVI